MPVPIGYGLYVLGNIVVRAIIKTQGKKLIAAGARKVSENAAKQIAKKRTGGVIKNATPGNVAGLIKNSRTANVKGKGAKLPKPLSKNSKTSNNKGAGAKPSKPLAKNSKTSDNKGAGAKPTKPPSKTSKTSNSKGSKANAAPKPSTTSKTSTNKGANAKPVKPLAKNSKTSNNKGSKANAAPKPSSTSKTSNSKGKGAKPTKPGSKTSKTSTSKGKQSNLPLIVGLGSGVAGAIMALGDKKPYAITEGSRTVKTREGKGSTVDKSKTSPEPKLRPKGLNKPAAGPVSDESFGAVFKRNRKANKATFTFKDKLYTTRTKEESIAEHKKKFGVKGKYK
jgi:hypothetical protein